MKRRLLVFLFVFSFFAGFIYVIAFVPTPIDKSLSQISLPRNFDDLARIDSNSSQKQITPILNVASTPVSHLILSPVPDTSSTPLDFPIQDLPAPTFGPTQVYGVMDELGLLPDDLPDFDPVILFMPIDTALTVSETIAYLKRIYPDEANFIETLGAYYSSAGVLGTYESRFIAPNCFENGQIFGFGTWLRNLPGEASAAQLLNDPRSGELYASIFGWQPIEEHPFVGNLYTAFVPASLCPQTSLIYVLDYQYGAMIITIMVYTHFETSFDVVYENLVYIKEYINKRIEKRTGVLAIGSNPSHSGDDEPQIVVSEVIPDSTDAKSESDISIDGPSSHDSVKDEILPTATVLVSTSTQIPSPSPSLSATNIPILTMSPLPAETSPPLTKLIKSVTPPQTMVSYRTPTITPTSTLTPTSTPALSTFPEELVCETWLNYTIDSLIKTCSTIKAGEMCASSSGDTAITAFNVAGLPMSIFGQPGSIISYRRLISEIVGKRDDAQFRLGTILLRPQDNVSIILYGEVRLGLSSDNPLDLFINNAIDEGVCPQTLPFVLINTQNKPIDFIVNAAPLSLQGTALLRILTPGNTLQVINLEGEIELESGSEDPFLLPAGQMTLRCISSPGDLELRNHTVYEGCPWLLPLPLDDSAVRIIDTARQFLERLD